MPAILQWFGSRARAYVDREAGKLFDRAGAAWKEKAREGCPVKTGALRASIGYVFDQSNKKLILFVDKSYAIMVEFGHGNVPANPFMRRALSAIPRIFRGFVTLQAPNTPEKYATGYEAHAKGKTRGAKFLASHRKRQNGRR